MSTEYAEPAFPVTVGVTDHEIAVLEYAARESVRAGCSLRLVHAYSVPPSTGGALYGYNFETSFRLDGEDILRQAKDLVHADGHSRHVACVLTRGLAPKVLERESKTARLMVVGQDPIKPWNMRIYEGRSAHHLATYSHCPVIIVPRNWEEPVSSARIVALVDDSRTAHQVLQFAFETADARSASVRLLHISRDRRGDEPWDSAEDLLGTWADRFPGVKAEVVVDHGKQRLLAVAAAHGTSLLVLGQPHIPRPSMILSNSLAQAVIARAACPVAVVPTAELPPSSS